MKRLSLAAVLLLVGACSSHPVVPDKASVKVSRDEAAKDCKEIGEITGSSMSAKRGSSEEALENLKVDASRRGANYVMIKSYSATGTAVNGVGYFCP